MNDIDQIDRKHFSKNHVSDSSNMSTDNQELYWSIEETARYLGYTPRWMRELAKKGKFFPFKVGKKWLFKKSLIDKYIADQNNT